MNTVYRHKNSLGQHFSSGITPAMRALACTEMLPLSIRHS